MTTQGSDLFDTPRYGLILKGWERAEKKTEKKRPVRQNFTITIDHRDWGFLLPKTVPLTKLSLYNTNDGNRALMAPHFQHDLKKFSLDQILISTVYSTMYLNFYD